MSNLIWILVGAVILIGVIGGYFQLMLFSNLKNKNLASIFFGAWVIKPENLNEKGKYYRKAIFICWSLVILLIIIIQSLQ